MFVCSRALVLCFFLAERFSFEIKERCSSSSSREVEIVHLCVGL
jgi:hypothetical protein